MNAILNLGWKIAHHYAPESSGNDYSSPALNNYELSTPITNDIVVQLDINTLISIHKKSDDSIDWIVYGSNYEFDTDDPKKIEDELNVNENALIDAKRKLNNTEYIFLLQEYVCSVCIRITRDMFALLPIRNTIVHALLDGKTIVSVNFDRQSLSKIKFRYIDPSDTLVQFEHNMDFNVKSGFSTVIIIE